jgi:hypothetical protein
MVIRQNNQGTFYRHLFSGIYENLTLYKRLEYPNRATIVAYQLYNCWKSTIRKYGEMLETGGDQSVSMMVTWHLPVTELKRYGVVHLNALDRISDKLGRFWQPEATTVITYDLMENYQDIECLRIDPDTV